MWYFSLVEIDINNAAVTLSWVWSGNPYLKVSIQYAVRRLIAESREVSKLRKWVL